MRRQGIALASRLLVLSVLTAPSAWAADTVTYPVSGIMYTHRSTSSPRKEIHILEVDLTRPGVRIRATRSGERGTTPSSFSSLVGAAAVVNGDFFNTNGSYDPTGLAIGEGVQWEDGSNSAGYHFVACTADNACTIDVPSQVTEPDASFRSAVGGRRALVKPGFVFTSEMDAACGSHCTTLHPRTAVGLKDGGQTLVLAVVEGRQDPIFGMTISQLANLMSSFGCQTALELDGGGSSTMVLAGARVSGRPHNEPSERRVANHLAVLVEQASASTGRLVGFVREGDIQNEAGPIAGATVTLSSGQSAATNAHGFYEFAEVAPGTVTLTATKEGFETGLASKDVAAGATTWRSIALVRSATTADPARGDGDGDGDGGGGGAGGGDRDGEGGGEGEGEEEKEEEGDSAGGADTADTSREGDAADPDGDDAKPSPGTRAATPGCSGAGAPWPPLGGLLLGGLLLGGLLHGGLLHVQGRSPRLRRVLLPAEGPVRTNVGVTADVRDCRTTHEDARAPRSSGGRPTSV